MADLYQFPPKQNSQLHQPKDRLVATFFVMAATSGRQLTCSAHGTLFGLELRLGFGDDLMRSELFRGVDAQERCAEAADSWRLALLQKGFTEVEIA